jgi:hypothetical protein
LRRLAVILARRVRLQIQVRLHAIHRGDHAAEARHEEMIHHARGRDGKVHRAPRGHDELVHRCHALRGIDEQPLPVERHDLHFEWLALRRQRARGIELVRSGPDHAAEEQDDQRGNRPHDQLDPP